MMNLFPYTDAHELNLDWVVEQVKANNTKVKDLTHTVENMHFDFDSKADKATTYTKTEVNTLLAAKADTSSLATVATSGNYNDLTNKPTIPAAQVNADWDAVSGVAQILNKPTIPAAQVNSDWDAASGVAQILNKPTLATVATSGNYNDLSNKPTIPAFSKTTLLDEQMPTSAGIFNYIDGASVDDFDFIALCCAWQSGSNSNCVLYPKGILYNQPIVLKLNNDPDGASYVRINSIGSTNCTAYGSSTNTRLRIYGIKY